MEVGEAVLLAGRYRLERVLGRGGMSEVWLARDVPAGSVVAIKRAQPGAGEEAREALLREARTGQQLHHANIVRVLDSGEAGGIPFLVAEYVEGQSLRERLSRFGALPEDDVAEMGRAVASALAHAHSRGIIHNDLKPENILLGWSGPKVADFGAATSLTETVGPQRARELMGTLAYLAPEVLQGEEPSPRSDIYALGLTLYEAAAGRLPFPGATPAAIAGQRLAQAAPPLRAFVPWASPELEAALARALQLDPAQRFASPAEFATSLRAAPMTSHPTVVIRPSNRRPAPPVAAAEGGKRSNNRGRVAAGVGAVGLLFAGGALAFSLAAGRDGGDDQQDELVAPPPAEPTATATPTRVPPTATPVRGNAGNRGEGNRNDSNNGNRGRGNRDDDDEDTKPKDRGTGNGQTIPSPDAAEETLSYIFESLRRAFERAQD